MEVNEGRQGIQKAISVDEGQTQVGLVAALCFFTADPFGRGNLITQQCVNRAHSSYRAGSIVQGIRLAIFRHDSQADATASGALNSSLI